MTITLTIESVDSLPDGGPITYQARNRGFQIGRQQHLDWTLPDPSRHISGLHCEVRFEKGGYWLYDVSSNGTFLNGSSARMKSPYRLATGDRLAIGQYIVSVTVDEPGAQLSDCNDERESSPRAEPLSSPSDDIWSTGEPAPAPIDRRELMPEPVNRRRAPDFSEQFLEFPDMQPAGSPQSGAVADPFSGSGETPFQLRPDAVAPRPRSEQPFHPAFAPPSPEPFAPAVPPSLAPAASVPQAAPGSSPASAPPLAPSPSQGVPEQLPAWSRPMPAAGPGFAGEPAGNFAGPSASVSVAPFSAQPFPPARPAPTGGDAGLSRFLQGLAAGAGVSPETFAGRDPAEVGCEIGESLKVCVEQLAQLLRARAAAKAMTKSSSRTMIGSAHNNPLKFIPGSAEAIDVMFSRRRPGFLSAKGSLESGFADLKRHELATYTAMQKALGKLLDELSPETISAKVGNATFSKKSRSWEVFVERWEQKTAEHENGMLDVFFAYFAEAYDAANKKG
ncbi:type VI secretion system-associated FHA domain protein TagH [Pseudaminobacter sp. 19-2017]|uniref:Type VI secretion system-associated FHA domain protein TagH n=1 Tax=Pseudaminobacter soli (ex Zhang et al. 2022) TaxID=2831468 RepID=A0A942DY71_9HYPH|nr:type VI secretion system-associated FHA domain protein TagH [Pseudaminobacter soli]MBS3650114.1 type VI secretion system-associated FHA domain protein TagH [Pseudaminobacter soli]